MKKNNLIARMTDVKKPLSFNGAIKPSSGSSFSKIVSNISKCLQLDLNDAASANQIEQDDIFKEVVCREILAPYRTVIQDMDDAKEFVMCLACEEK